MSAIAGIIHFDGKPVESGQIEKMTSALSHRGLDGIGHWVKGPVGLGHCMLRTTPESLAETQPLVTHNGKLVIVMDGRIDNASELRRELKAQGFEPRTCTDTELVRGAYLHWGEDSPKHLLGDFAFAIYDTREERLFCARDHVGGRPFYYVCNDQYFAFSSEDETLLGFPGVTAAPNEELVAALLVPTLSDVNYQQSWLRDVSTLPPAHTLTVSARSPVMVRKYWQLVVGDELRFANDRECEEAFLDVFGEAFRCRLRSTGRVAAMMSGGLDSASIAAMAKRLAHELPGGRLRTYSALSDEPESCVESRCIQSLTSSDVIEPHFVSVPSFTGMVSLEDLIEAAWSKAHPIDNSILLPAMMFLAASRQGDRVVLHGASGDLAMHVPLRYPAYLMREGMWRRAWHECKGASRNNNYLRGSWPSSLFAINMLAAYLPPKLRTAARRLRGSSALAQSLVSPEFSQRLRLRERLSRVPTEQRNGIAKIRSTHAELLCGPLGIMLGMTGYDRLAGRYGVEVRDPLADIRVLNFFIHAPLGSKVRDGWTKYLVRTAFAQELSPMVRWRLGKEHLGWQLIARLMKATPSLVSTTLHRNSDDLQMFVNLDAIPNNRYDSTSEMRYDPVVLALWMTRLRRKQSS